MFSGIPFTSRSEFGGHAVRAMYASSGATHYYAETGDRTDRETLDRLWRDLVKPKNVRHRWGGVTRGGRIDRPILRVAECASLR